MKLPWYIHPKPVAALVAGLGGFFAIVNHTCAQPWAATTSPVRFWNSLASSADGTTLVAAGDASFIDIGGYMLPLITPIYVSSDAGATWSQTSTPSNFWSSVACSADGAKLVAAVGGAPPRLGIGLIYTSPDSGATWTPTSAPGNFWSSVACSADGAKLVALAGLQWQGDDTNGYYLGDGAIYRSQDSGATWTQISGRSNSWTSVAASADGTKWVAVSALWIWNYGAEGEGAIYRSLDWGATWSRTSAPSNQWSSVAASADGTKWVAVAEPVWDSDGQQHVGGGVYRSLDSGATWMQVGAASDGSVAVASSADGTKLVTDRAISTDSGATWTGTGGPGGGMTAIACSADGYRVVAGGYFTSLYTLSYSGPWRLANAPLEDWSCVASSTNGVKLVAAASSGAICTSSDSGATWMRTTAPSNEWHSVASSADGAKLVAAAWLDSGAGGNGAIYTSSNSGGAWTETSAPRKAWSAVASSADGTKLVAVANDDGTICTSSDSGTTWTPTTWPGIRWIWVASSADGTRLAAVAGENRAIYTSSDSGATWTQAAAPSNNWYYVASSADGTKLVAVAYLSGLYTSTDSGATWTQAAAAPHGTWYCVASSADGTRLVAVAYYPSGLYTSTNSGATWESADSPAMDGWVFLACSADGTHVVAAAAQGCILILRPPAPAPPLPPSPRMTIGRSGANLGLCWLVPSIRFGLQQSTDLSAANWVDLPVSPTLDFTNLHHRVTLTPSSSRSFYRLKQQ